MEKMNEYIKSGIIETYVLGLASPSEAREVEEISATNPEVRVAIEEFSEMLERQALINAITPDPIIKPMVLATINYITRREKGELPGTPPMLNEDSLISDYSEWLQRDDMMRPTESDDVYARIINYTPEVTTAIVWIKNYAPAEEHTDEIERFLIVEGTCKIIIEKNVYELSPGDFFEIPLFRSHLIKVTSDPWCKAILQRVAA